MFSGCSSLSSVTCLATSGIGQFSSTTNWLSSVADEGIFTMAQEAVDEEENYLWPEDSPDGIPENWSVDY